MIPYPPLMFPDAVTFHRSTSAVTSQGAPTRTFAAGEDMAASVQSSQMSRMDTGGRVVTEATHSVRTARNPEANAGDKFEWFDRSGGAHTLTVRGRTKPGGIGDVIWITPCLETK